MYICQRMGTLRPSTVTRLGSCAGCKSSNSSWWVAFNGGECAEASSPTCCYHVLCSYCDSSMHRSEAALVLMSSIYLSGTRAATATGGNTVYARTPKSSLWSNRDLDQLSNGSSVNGTVRDSQRALPSSTHITSTALYEVGHTNSQHRHTDATHCIATQQHSDMTHKPDEMLSWNLTETLWSNFCAPKKQGRRILNKYFSEHDWIYDFIVTDGKLHALDGGWNSSPATCTCIEWFQRSSPCRIRTRESLATGIGGGRRQFPLARPSSIATAGRPTLCIMDTNGRYQVCSVSVCSLQMSSDDKGSSTSPKVPII